MNIDKTQINTNIEDFMHTCAVCKSHIGDEVEVWGLGAKKAKDVDLFAFQGAVMPIIVEETDLVIPAMVALENSDAHKNGEDMVFMTCSQGCAVNLKITLEKETGIEKVSSLN